MKLLMLIALAFPVAASAADSLKELKKILTSESEESAAKDACFEDHGTVMDERDIPGDAKKAFVKVKVERKRLKLHEPTALSFSAGRYRAVMINDAIGDEGCCNFFTSKGAHVADLCSGEDGVWTWNSKQD